MGAKELKHTENVYNALKCPEAGSLVTKVAREKLGFNLDAPDAPDGFVIDAAQRLYGRFLCKASDTV